MVLDAPSTKDDLDKILLNDLRIAAVIPMYNGAKYIERALNSVFQQTVPPKEVIVVDDGSTDDSPHIVEQMAMDRPITLLRKPNGGQSSARNMGIAYSTSDLIALLDQDDIWYPKHIEALAKQFLDDRQSELGWVYSNLDEIDEAGHMVRRSCLSALPLQNPKQDLYSCLATDMFILPSSTMISKKAFDAVGGFDERLSGFEDDDLFLRLFRAGYDNVYLDVALAQWRIYPVSASFTYRTARSRMIYFRKLLEQFPDDPDFERHLTRDFLIPRFFPWLVREYTRNLRKGTDEDVRTAYENLRFACSIHKFRVRMTIGFLLPLVRSPTVARALLPLMTLMQPLVRRFLR